MLLSFRPTVISKYHTIFIDYILELAIWIHVVINA